MALSKDALVVSDDELPKAEEPTSDPKPMPAKVKMESLYGYYEDGGRYRSWAQYDVITDEAEIRLLVERGAPFSVVE
jgi:hypothetical protein